jgi:hypothetical protein
MRQLSGPSCLLSYTTPNATLTIGLKFRMSRSDSVSDKCEGSNPLLKRNGSGRCRESSRIFSESDATCCGQLATGCCEAVPSLFGIR